MGGVSYYLSTTEKVLSSGTICLGFWGQEGGTRAIQVFTIHAARLSPPAVSRACDRVSPLSACKLLVSGQQYGVSQATDRRRCLRLPTSPDWPHAGHSFQVKAREATTQAYGQRGSTPRQAEVAGAGLMYGSASVDPRGHRRCTGVYLHCLTRSMAWMRNEWRASSISGWGWRARGSPQGAGRCRI